MLITCPDPKYKAQYVGTQMTCIYDDEPIKTLTVKSIGEARTTLNDWARLKISIDDIVYFQKLASQYVGCSVDDIQYSDDRKTVLINGKQIEHI